MAKRFKQSKQRKPGGKRKVHGGQGGQGSTAGAASDSSVSRDEGAQQTSSDPLRSVPAAASAATAAATGASASASAGAGAGAGAGADAGADARAAAGTGTSTSSRPAAAAKSARSSSGRGSGKHAGGNKPLVLVTGASGYIAGHCVIGLLEDGYRVRGTIRSLANQATVARLSALHPAAADRLEIVEADLTRDDGWNEAVAGCTYVLHVASPFPASSPDDEMELIGPAVDGTRRVLSACADSGTVKRVVQTSSVAAVAYGHKQVAPDKVYTEEDWSDPDGCEAYAKSKTLAERSAWEFVEALPAERRFELAVINPGFVAGPVLDSSVGTSGEIFRRLLAREMPACPELGFAVVDVRDLARAHIAAMTSPQAAGHRFICAGDHYWIRELAKMLSEEFAPFGYRVPTKKLPYWMLWIAARFDKTLRMSLGFVGRKEIVSHEQATRLLGWEPRPVEETVVDMGHSLIEFGVVPRKKQYDGVGDSGVIADRRAA